MGYAIIEVPSMAGDPSHPAAAGPAIITRALRQAGYEFPTRRVTVQDSSGDVIADSVRVNVQLKEAVVAIGAAGQIPVVLAGSCDVAPAVLAGIDRACLGVIWIDAHADFNTPESSVSGFWPGMTLAVVVGDCGEDVWGVLGGRPVAPERVLLVGVRSLSPEEEAQRLQRSGVHAGAWRDGLPREEVETALEALGGEIDDVYVHLDLDALDPSVGTGIVDPPEPGGLSSSQLAELVTGIRTRLNVAAATVATYTPANDDGRTLQVATDAIRQLIDHSA
jgi:arginase